MKKHLAILLILIAGMILTTCEDEPTEPKSNTVYFNNRATTTVTVKDNSGRSMFEEIKVRGYNSQTLTYECPSVGSCDIDFDYTYTLGLYSTNRWYVCICTDNYEYNETYTFGYWPDNPDAEENQKCSSCR
jgi:hypothetical protein|tara:strand:+ start:525 stop:917 length:393 start_codon:yes stop_codon:yes gene_type:complete